LDQLLFEAGATPPVYFAVLALDGDHIGKWLSGELTPPVGNVLAPKAVEYFKNTLPDWYRLHPGAGNAGEIADDTKKWLGAPRPISPSWHLQFSEALANFGLHLARRLVEEVHQGQLIYSGGDDVLAMLPADNAITCARDLGAAFQGRLRAMSKAAQALFTPNVPQGFLQLAQPSEQEPKWPLLMPGPKMTVSVGPAIGHIKEPLQDMIQEAQRAEKRAKGNPEMLKWDKNREKQSWTLTEGWGRDALALTLFKRNGETIRWGAKFSSPAFPLLAYMQKHYRESWDPADGEPPIRRRFPYRLAQLLGVYETNAPLTDDLQQIAEKELVHVISRQTATDDEARQTGSDFLRAELEKLCGAYLDELRSFSCDRPEENGPTTKNVPAPRPLREFFDLFLAEAFIRRQGD
jgi:hypothetical protein